MQRIGSILKHYFFQWNKKYQLKNARKLETFVFEGN